MTNVSKHAKATAVDISIFLDEDEVQVMVWDNGVGLGDKECNSAHGFGLEGMRERAKALGGQVELFSSPGDGLRVTLRFPKERSNI